MVKAHLYWIGIEADVLDNVLTTGAPISNNASELEFLTATSHPFILRLVVLSDLIYTR